MADITIDAPVKSKSIVFEFLKGFVKENPVFVQVLGTCPTLAVTTTVTNGMGMGLATLFVLVLSSFFASAVRRIVPDQVRIPVYTVIIATFVTLADLFMRAYIPPLSKSLGPYVPLIVVNCIIMGRIEAYATRNSVGKSVVDAFGMGTAFTVSLMIMGAVREILGHGTLFGANILGSGFHPMLVMVLPPGAFFTFGILMAAFNSVKDRNKLVLVGG
jgi:electron transport complex protein RnfE